MKLYKGYIIKIERDDTPECPRNWDNLGTMLCWHNTYNLGDMPQEKLSQSDLWVNYGSDKELRELCAYYCKNKPLSDLKADFYNYEYDYSQFVYDNDLTIHPSKDYPDDIILLPLYLYDHSGITINTTEFSCRWDSGQVGFIYVTREKLKKENLNNLPDSIIEKYLANEVKTYDQYLTGDVHGFIIEKDGKYIDSCWGFFGYNYCLQEVKERIDHLYSIPLEIDFQI